MLRSLLARLIPDRDASTLDGTDALVQVYLRAGRCFVEASHRTRYAEAGYWIASGEVRTLDEAADDATLGSAVLEAIAASRIEVPVPPRGTKLQAGLFRAMGIRSRRAAMSGTRSCLVSRELRPARALRIEALANGGTQGDGRGWTGLPADAAGVGGAATTIPLDAVTPQVLGAAVRRALHAATHGG